MLLIAVANMKFYVCEWSTTKMGSYVTRAHFKSAIRKYPLTVTVDSKVPHSLIHFQYLDYIEGKMSSLEKNAPISFEENQLLSFCIHSLCYMYACIIDYSSHLCCQN